MHAAKAVEAGKVDNIDARKQSSASTIRMTGVESYTGRNPELRNAAKDPAPFILRRRTRSSPDRLLRSVRSEENPKTNTQDQAGKAAPRR